MIPIGLGWFLTVLDWLSLCTRVVGAYRFWKQAKNTFFPFKFSLNSKKSILEVKNSFFKKNFKLLDNASDCFVRCLKTRNTVRNHPRPIGINMKPFYEKKKKSNFLHFLNSQNHAFSPLLSFFKGLERQKNGFFEK